MRFEQNIFPKLWVLISVPNAYTYTLVFKHRRVFPTFITAFIFITRDEVMVTDDAMYNNGKWSFSNLAGQDFYSFKALLNVPTDESKGKKFLTNFNRMFAKFPPDVRLNGLAQGIVCSWEAVTDPSSQVWSSWGQWKLDKSFSHFWYGQFISAVSFSLLSNIFGIPVSFSVPLRTSTQHSILKFLVLRRRFNMFCLGFQLQFFWNSSKLITLTFQVKRMLWIFLVYTLLKWFCLLVTVLR